MSFVLLGILNSQAAAGGVGTPAFDLLETQVLGSDTSSVSFTGLDSYTDYKHLQIRMLTRVDATGFDVGSVDLQFNSDTGSNYASHHIQGANNSVASYAETSATEISSSFSPTNDQPANAFAPAVIDILDFSSANKNTTTRCLSGLPFDSERLRLSSGLWNNTNAVTSIQITPGSGSNLVSGSRFSLYGIKG